MAALTHFVKQDFSYRDRTVSVWTEESYYTVSWSDLTGAGFANGDQVGLIVSLRTRASTVSTHAWITVRQGSTFSGAADIASYQRIESAGTVSNTGHAYLALDQVTLTTNDNFYIGTRADSTDTVTNDEYTFFMFKTSGLGSDNYKYQTTSPTGNAPTSPTDGASVTLPAGDWLIFATTLWLDDSASEDAFMTIVVGGSEVQRVSLEGEDTANAFVLGAMVYAPGLSSNTVAKIQYWGEGLHDIDRNAIMAIRLDAFKTKWGVHSTNTIQHQVLDTYQEAAGNGSFTPAVTGPVLAFGFFKHLMEDVSEKPYGRIQVDSSDWPTSGVGRTSTMVNGPVNAHFAPMLIGYGTLTGSTAYDFDFDIAEDSYVGEYYDCIQQDAVIFTLELAGTVRTFTYTSTGESNTVSASAAILRAIPHSSTGESNTTTAILATLRPQVLSAIGESTTALSSLILQCTFIMAPIGESLTGSPAMNVLRSFPHNAIGESATGDTILNVLRRCVLLSEGESLTSTPTLLCILKFILSSIGESNIPDCSMSILRSLAQFVEGESVTSSPAMTMARSFTYQSTGESLTATPPLSNLLSQVLSSTGESLTSDAALAVLRSLAWSAAGESVTSNAALEIAAAILFLLNSVGESLSASSALNIVRPIPFLSIGESLTANSILAVVRPLVWVSTGESLTSDTTMALVRGFTWLTTGESLTSTPAMLNLLNQTLNSSGESLTSSAVLGILRILSWLSTGESLTSDANLILAALLNQYSFRFVNDNGDEDESTFRDSLNTNISILPDNIIRVRFLLDSTGDLAGKQFQIEYRRKPAGGSFGDWKKIE